LIADNVVISAFSEAQVERLTGLTASQLRCWDQTGFFAPAYADENRRLPYSRIYSFKDVVALRTLSVLRNHHKVPLQHLRKVAQKLSHLADDLWTKTTLYVLDKKVVFLELGTNVPREVVSGQFVISLELKTVVADTKKAVEILCQRSDNQIGRIERSRYVNHNAWVVAGTRISTRSIRRFKEAGYTIDQRSIRI
jgi:DNA-binding transcriptional MerR regulator